MRAEEFFKQVDEQFPAVEDVAGEVDPPFILASNVYRLRKVRGLTQAQLAEAVGVRQPRIAEIERGDANPRLDTLARLARALDVTVSALLEPDPASEETTSGAPVDYSSGRRPLRRVAEPR